MRMWMIPPDMMCKKHILAEHGEIHKFKKSFEKHISIKGRITPVVQIEPMSMKSRHDELIGYMNHNSPYEQPDLSYLPDEHRYAKVDREASIIELGARCPDCRAKINIALDGAKKERER